MIKLFTLVFSLILSINTSVLLAQNSNLVNTKPKPTLDSLETLNAAAKAEYEGKTTHPKLVKRNFAEDAELMNTLSAFKKIVIHYDARNMGFNSLFVKFIVENPQVQYFLFTNEQGVLWVKEELDSDRFLFDLNSISMSPVTFEPELNSVK